MSPDIRVRIEGGRGVITMSEPFFEDEKQQGVYDQAIRQYTALFNALCPAGYGSLAKLSGGSNNQKRERE